MKNDYHLRTYFHNNENNSYLSLINEKICNYEININAFNNSLGSLDINSNKLGKWRFN